MPQWLTLDELLECIYGGAMLNYNLLMPVLLFLPSLCKPHEAVLALLRSFTRRLNSEPCDVTPLMNILIIIRCWLRESFAHTDFTTDTLVIVNIINTRICLYWMYTDCVDMFSSK